MKKKIFSSLLLVAFAFAATSMFVSCKDYDDDINELRSLIDKNDSALRQALEQQKNELNGYITTLQGQMRDAQADITTLKGQMTTAQGDISKLKEQMTTALAKISTLEEKMTAAEDAITAINNLLGGKLENGKTYKAAVEEIYGKVASLETDMAKVLEEEIPGLKDSIGLLRAVDADLQLQINTLKTFKTKMETEVIPGLQLRDTQLSDSIKDIISQLGVIREAVRTNAIAIGEINNMIGGKLENGQTYKEFVEQLRTDLNKANDDIEDLQEGLSQLNVLIKTSLRSLVFKPDCYYEGIEATKILSLNYKDYSSDWKDAAWNVEEKYGVNDDGRYPSKDGFKVLDFVASYYMNPSSADLSNAEVKVLSDDYDYIAVRAAAAGFNVKEKKVENGMLNVFLTVNDKSKIKKIDTDKMVTTFATQVNLTKGGQDTTITSDWAAVIAEEAGELKIAHKDDVVNWMEVANEKDACELTKAGHLFPTVKAAKEALPQDTVAWNNDKGLDLKTLVALHYTDKEQKHVELTAAQMEKYGLEFKFELTQLILGDNETSESAHAAIKGSIFRPQPSDKAGKQQEFGVDQIRETEVGRTPLVRVSLIDSETKKVLEYGYIRIQIVEPEQGPEPDQPDKFISYNGDDYTYNGECNFKGWNYKTTWYVTEYDIHDKFKVTREEFMAHYKEVKEGDVLKQFELVKIVNEKDGEATFKDAKEAIGDIMVRHDVATAEDGTRTSIIEWNISSDDAKKYFIENGKDAPYKRAIKFESDNKKKWPDIYVLFTTGAYKENKPEGTVKLDATTLIDNFWYSTNGTGTSGFEGFDEIHSNTLTPEDNAGGTAEVLDATFSDVFYGNLGDLSKLITVTDPTDGEYAVDKLKVTFAFDKSNDNNKFIGLTGNEYNMLISDDGLTLYAYMKKDKSDKQAVAKIVGNDVKTQKIEYQKNEYAKDLLNAHAAQDLNGALVAVIGLQAKNKCNELPLTNNTFDVRFLRPLNVYNIDGKTIEDASVQGLQEIKLADLVEFNDWRLAWNGKENSRGNDGAYYKYYGIKGITIDMVTNGQVISTNAKVLANLGQATNDKFVSLQEVSNQLDFKYFEADGGKLVYKNLSNTLTEFSLQIPVTVEYIWGKVPAIATVKVIRTHANAKKN